jgi:hypothetical protein
VAAVANTFANASNGIPSLHIQVFALHTHATLITYSMVTAAANELIATSKSDNADDAEDAVDDDEGDGDADADADPEDDDEDTEDDEDNSDASFKECC